MNPQPQKRKIEGDARSTPRTTAFLFGGVLLLLLVPLSWAHHSFAAFDFSKRYKITGVVKSFDWTNPHSWVHVLVTEPGGDQVLWDIETGAPNVNVRLGWRADDLKPGDKVTLVLNPLRSGEKSGTLAYVVLANGRVLVGNGAGEGIPSPADVQAGKVDINALLSQVPPPPAKGGVPAPASPQPSTPTAKTGAPAAAGPPTARRPGAARSTPSFLQPFQKPVPSGYAQPSADPKNLEGAYVYTQLAPTGSGALPYKPKAKAEVERLEASMRAGNPVASLSDLCRQPGMAAELSLNFPFRIVQTASQVLILFEEYHSIVRIHMDQALPTSAPVSYEGYSVGHWEGDSLVVETTGLDPRTRMGLGVAPHGSALRQKLVIRKTDGGRHLNLQFTFDDPEHYIAAWSLPLIVADWRPDFAHLSEYDCEETAGSAQNAVSYGLKVERPKVEK